MTMEEEEEEEEEERVGDKSPFVGEVDGSSKSDQPFHDSSLLSHPQPQPQPQLVDSEDKSYQVMQNPQLVTQVKETNGTVLDIDVTDYFLTDQMFDSREHLIKWCREVGRQTLFKVVIVRSDKGTSRKMGRLTLGCRGLSEKRNDIDVRVPKPKGYGCPFTLKGIPYPKDRWKLEVKCGQHNHRQTLIGNDSKVADQLSYGKEQIHTGDMKNRAMSEQAIKTIKMKSKRNLPTSNHSLRTHRRLVHHKEASPTFQEVEVEVFAEDKKLNVQRWKPRSAMKFSRNLQANKRLVHHEDAWSTFQEVEVEVIAQDKKPNLQRRRPRSGMKYLGAFPQCIRVYINDIHETDRDGNCGFRAVAELMGLDEENGWQKVRRDLFAEMDCHAQQYEEMFGIEIVNEIRETLICFDSPCTKDHWMSMPYTGYLIAATYNVVLVFLSAQQCITFLPTRDAPDAELPHRLITVGYVKGCHYVSVYLKPDAPIPPIASLWQNHHSKAADFWPATYIERMRLFEEIIPTEVAICDHIIVDED